MFLLHVLCAAAERREAAAREENKAQRQVRKRACLRGRPAGWPAAGAAARPARARRAAASCLVVARGAANSKWKPRKAAFRLDGACACHNLIKRPKRRHRQPAEP